MKQLGCAMVLLPATIITRRLLTNVWNSWCIAMIIVIATKARAQDLKTLTETNELPPQVLKGIDMSHQAYRLNTFDCDKPEDVLTQSIPQGCTVRTSDDTDPDTNTASKQDYTILQKVATFEYPATLCTLRRSRHYYDCVWKSHVRIAAPAKIYQHETLQVHECSTAANTRIFIDPISRIRHSLNANLEVNNFQSTVIGSLSYDGSHSHCLRMDSHMDSNRMESLFVTESLEVTIRTVTIRGEFDTGSIIVKENGVSIPAVYRQDTGMIANFGTLVFQ